MLMKNYFTKFVTEVPRNEVGKGLFLVTIVCVTFFGGIAFAVTLIGFPVNFWQAWLFPILFGFLTVTHFIMRPITVTYYKQ